MDVPHVRAGWIQGAHTPDAIEAVRRRAEQWAKRGARGRVPRQGGDRAAPRHGAVRRRLARSRAAARSSRSPTRAASRGRRSTPAPRSTGRAASRPSRATAARFTVTTRARGATVTAEKVVVCTNGYTGDLVPEAAPDRDRAELVPDRDPSALRQHRANRSCPQGQVSSDTRKLLLYFRLDHAGPLHHGRTRLVPRAAKRRRLGPSRARRRQDVPAAQRRADRASLVRPGRAHARFPAAPARARARPPRRHRLHGPRRRPADGDGAEDGRVRRDRRQARAAVPARADPPAALPPAAQGLRLGDHRLVPDDGWRREAAA